MERQCAIGIVGGGPAGAALAIRLSRLGHAVLIVTDGRTRYGLQGVSRRTLEALINLGAAEALKTVGPPAPRLVLWNGAEASPNDESLVDRRELDRALLRDATTAGADVVSATAHEVPPPSGRLEATLRDGETIAISASFWVDARGRSALRNPVAEAVGPATLSVQQHFRSSRCGARSGIVSVEDGWCWVGVREGGDGVLQYTTRRHRGALAGLRSPDLAATLARRYPVLARLLTGTRPAGVICAHPAGLALACAEVPQFRAGDVLLAPDPLSGHGLYEALSGSRYVAAAINTCLHAPNDGALARRFVRDRARERYAVLAAMSARVHGQETRWPAQPFWAERRQAPEHTAKTSMAPGIVHAAPVLNHDRIVAADVVVTPDHPRGVWRVHGVPIVDLLRRLRDGQSLEVATGVLGVPVDRGVQVVQWLRREGLHFNVSR